MGFPVYDFRPDSNPGLSQTVSRQAGLAARRRPLRGGYCHGLVMFAHGEWGVCVFSPCCVLLLVGSLLPQVFVVGRCGAWLVEPAITRHTCFPLALLYKAGSNVSSAPEYSVTNGTSV